MDDKHLYPYLIFAYLLKCIVLFSYWNFKVNIWTFYSAESDRNHFQSDAPAKHDYNPWFHFIQRDWYRRCKQLIFNVTFKVESWPFGQMPANFGLTEKVWFFFHRRAVQSEPKGILHIGTAQGFNYIKKRKSRFIRRCCARCSECNSTVWLAPCSR